jgi:hypothetical protein
MEGGRQREAERETERDRDRGVMEGGREREVMEGGREREVMEGGREGARRSTNSFNESNSRNLLATSQGCMFSQLVPHWHRMRYS